MKNLYFNLSVLLLILTVLTSCNKEECRIYYDSKIPDSLEIVLHTGDKVLFLSNQMDTMEFDIVRVDTIIENTFDDPMPPLYSGSCYYYIKYYSINTTYKNDSLKFTHREFGNGIKIPDKYFYASTYKHLDLQYMYFVNSDNLFDNSYYGSLDTFYHVVGRMFNNNNHFYQFAYTLQYGVIRFSVDSTKYTLFKIIKK